MNSFQDSKKINYFKSIMGCLFFFLNCKLFWQHNLRKASVIIFLCLIDKSNREIIQDSYLKI